MDDSFNELIYLKCSHFKEEQWEYYVVGASWVPYHGHYVIRGGGRRPP